MSVLKVGIVQHACGNDKFEKGLLKAKGEQGICRVICFSKDHSLTIPQMSVDAIGKVVDLWIKEYQELGSKPFINHVQIFENKGSIMGCSNPHPHGQIWAQSSIPGEAAKKSREQLSYWNTHGKSLVLQYLEEEIEAENKLAEISQTTIKWSRSEVPCLSYCV